MASRQWACTSLFIVLLSSIILQHILPYRSLLDQPCQNLRNASDNGHLKHCHCYHRNCTAHIALCHLWQYFGDDLDHHLWQWRPHQRLIRDKSSALAEFTGHIPATIWTLYAIIFHSDQNVYPHAFVSRLSLFQVCRPSAAWVPIHGHH
jgi:hypothetical protein